MKKTVLTIVLILSSVGCAFEYQSPDLNPILENFKAIRAPEPTGLMLKKGDRLAICGDSITEQKMYSLIIETYLTVCEPELDIKVRQYGWGGETARGFLGRMKNDCLRFNPSIAMTCYGMNDHRYLPYQDEFGKEYRDNTTAIVKLFKENGTRVILGSPGCVGKKPWWQSNPDITTKDLNLSLLKFRNIDIEIAAEQNVAFADVYLPMLLATYQAQTLYGSDFKVAGDDGVHPDWAGHMVMAYAFLKAMGLDGQIGTLTVDLKGNKAATTKGHEVTNFADNTISIKSYRYPYCDTGEPDKQNSIRAGMNLIPFNQNLNRFILVVINTQASNYKVTWGNWEKTYPAEQLNKGINLAADFKSNPFVEPFNKVNEAVKKKQEYETKQIKSLFHGPEGGSDMETVVNITEKARGVLADELARSFKPVEHTIRITAE